ncbi:OmpA family protein, partial [Vibrio vulnificus]|nr:OmpA family protein [Vibrio vulnificus]EIV8609077.1 OmpA family protein [Vibrio vulnificus]EIZ1012481.1 OmpA family protein [Vibrio vulnificus]ELQ2514257.1 OmpA family protein [Vibrio vulnificus]
LDQQEKALRDELMSSGVQVKRIGENELVLIMENGIGFQSGEHLLEPSVYKSLNGIAKVLVEYPSSYLQIIGYTDNVGDESSNQRLSEQRANSVKDYLISQNVSPNRISTSGMGERSPICQNSTAEGRACNRRVEIKIQAI